MGHGPKDGYGARADNAAAEAAVPDVGRLHRGRRHRPVVEGGYVHVIGDLRGSGYSQGEHVGNYNAGGVPLGQDAYDFIEWVAAQPWCDGNVGMIGISYFGSMQVLAAAERPPSLKAIFVSGGHYASTRRRTTAG